MPEGDDILVAASRWVDKAEEDLKLATLALRQRKGCPVNGVCFHAQQCVEKYLKGYLAWRQIRFPKTHDLAELVPLLPHGVPLPLSAEEQEELTQYATVTRYPGDYSPVTYAQATGAVRTARRVRRAIRKALPKKALKTEARR